MQHIEGGTLRDQPLAPLSYLRIYVKSHIVLLCAQKDKDKIFKHTCASNSTSQNCYKLVKQAILISLLEVSSLADMT